MEKQFFRCYELFYKIWKELPDDLKTEYYESLMEYGLYGNEPTNPIIKALLLWPMYSINKSDEISAAKSEYMKGNQNARKNRDKLGNRIKTEKNREEQTQTEKNTWSIRSIKKNKEDIRSIEDNNKEKIYKKKYLDFVYLAPTEYDKLTELYGIKQTGELIDKLNNYIGSTGKRYKSHYYTILNRAKKETNVAPKQSEAMRERERLRIRQEAEQILNSNKATHGENENPTANWRADISCN